MTVVVNTLQRQLFISKKFILFNEIIHSAKPVAVLCQSRSILVGNFLAFVLRGALGGFCPQFVEVTDL